VELEPDVGAPRIQAELHKLGIDVSDSTVRRYRPTRPRQPSQSWRSFLENHLGDIVAMDFFVVPTATFRVLYVLLIMAHDRRRILRFNVTTSPSAAWTARQVLEAFPYGTRPRFLIPPPMPGFSTGYPGPISMDAPSSCSRPSSSWSASLASSRRAPTRSVGRLHRHHYHGVLAPNAKLRPPVVALGRPDTETPSDIEPSRSATALTPPASDPPRRPATASRIRWAQLLAHIYDVMPLLCPACSGEMRILAFLTDPPTVSAILIHLELPHRPPPISPARGPPQHDFLVDQPPDFDPADPEPVPDQRFASVPSSSISPSRTNSMPEGRRSERDSRT
jgi:hypothetical protein